METNDFSQSQDCAAGTFSINHIVGFPSLDKETRSHVETACAAFHLTRKNQTLRAWACFENGPLQPRRINGRLSWAVADIRNLLNGSAAK